MSIWKYNKFFNPSIQEKYQFSLGEGLTPVYNYGYFASKAEYKNPTGTHKDRSFAYWISYLVRAGIKRAVITSSGNSARSAKEYCRMAGIDLTVFTRETSLTPKKDAFQYAKRTGAYLLRASTDDLALQGYKTIAFELQEQLPDLAAIIIPTSSASTLMGIYQGFKEINFLPRLYAVQTPSCNPIVRHFTSPGCKMVNKERSLARSIVDRIAHRKKEAIAAVKESRGGGAVVSNKELRAVQKDFPDRGWESLLTVAALKKLNFKDSNGKIVLLFTN